MYRGIFLEGERTWLKYSAGIGALQLLYEVISVALRQFCNVGGFMQQQRVSGGLKGAFAAGLMVIASTSYAAAYKDQFKALVVGVSDGDTIEVLDATRGRLQIRLTDIDAPEIKHGRHKVGQAYGTTAKDQLARWIYGKSVELGCYESDRYGRSVCRVMLGDSDIGADLVSSGLAWANRSNTRYVRDKTVYGLEEKAKAQKIGIWHSAGAIAPWDWRKECWEQGKCAGAN